MIDESLNNSFNGQIIIVSGMSGAGKSVALKALEDIGFEAMDNIPLSIMPLTIDKKNPYTNLAIGVDIRNRDFSEQNFLHNLHLLKNNMQLKVILLFLDCDDEELRKRFTTNRRRHPITNDHLITDSIKHERDLLHSLKEYADIIVDSTNLSGRDLQKYIKANFSLGSSQQLLSIIIISFAFRSGVPQESDLVFDVRFLKNPFYDNSLKDFNGKDERVGKFIEQDPNFTIFMNNLSNLLSPLLPSYQQEGKSYLTIAIGCTGGIHRSVYSAICLQKILESQGYKAEARHREL
jgi:UPF0042 nucleotide-binding protein